MFHRPQRLIILLLLTLMLALAGCRGGDKTEPTVVPQTQPSTQSDQPGAKPFDSSPLPAP